MDFALSSAIIVFSEDVMKPGRHCAQEPDGLFKTPLERFINMNDPLVQLAHRIDWNGLEAKIAARFSEEGRPAVPARFMLGMARQNLPVKLSLCP